MASNDLETARLGLLGLIRQIDVELATMEPKRQKRAKYQAMLEELEAEDATTPAATVPPLTRAKAGPQPRVLVDASMQVLREKQTVMSVREIYDAIRAKGWWLDRPWNRMRTTIAGALDARAKRPNSDVVKPEAGRYRAVPAGSLPL